MRHNKTEIYLHFVWTTWDRLPLISAEVERELHRNLQSLASKKGCVVVALNGIEDHVHLLLQVPPTCCSVAELVKHLKGVSSHFVNDTLQPSSLFKWQASYSVFSVSRWDVDKVRAYVENQKEHHRRGTAKPQLEFPSAQADG